MVPLLVSCLKVAAVASVAPDTASAWCAVSQCCTVLETALLLGDLVAAISSPGVSATPLREQLQSGALLWAVLAARTLHTMGQALQEVAVGWSGAAIPGNKRQLVSVPDLLDTAGAAVRRLGSVLEQLRVCMPAPQLDRCLQQAQVAQAGVQAVQEAAAESP
jgi:hypothetical protein